MLHVRREFLLAFFVGLLVLSCGQADTIETTPPTTPEAEEVTTTTTAASTTTTTVDASVALAAGLEYSVAWLSYVFPDAADKTEDSSASRTGAGLTTSTPGPVASGTPAPTGLEPCGGDLPPCWVKKKESGGSYTAYNPTGCGGRSCGGAWQFDPRTWNGYGGYQFAQDAPPEVQDAKARELWANGAGCSHWAACG